MIDHNILSGSSHAAGDFGHMTIVGGGESCSCGNKGCWNVYASNHATVCRYLREKKKIPDQSSHSAISDLIDLVKNGDDAAHAAMITTAQYIGIGIVSIIRAFDPEVIVIGGPITQCWDLAYPHIIQAVSMRDYLGKQRKTIILPTSLSGNPPLMGAAALSIRKMFTDYSIAA
jgi:predicted NBD/HSP70 family sugar kinase